MPVFKYEQERKPGMGMFFRWHCPKCDRRGELTFSHEMAKQDAKASHGYGRCPDK
jgi:hypothetical protein